MVSRATASPPQQGTVSPLLGGTAPHSNSPLPGGTAPHSNNPLLPVTAPPNNRVIPSKRPVTPNNSLATLSNSLAIPQVATANPLPLRGLPDAPQAWTPPSTPGSPP